MSQADLIDFWYRLMWTEFSSQEVMAEKDIIHLIGVVGLHWLITYGRLNKNEEGLYILDKSYLGVDAKCQSIN